MHRLDVTYPWMFLGMVDDGLNHLYFSSKKCFPKKKKIRQKNSPLQSGTVHVTEGLCRSRDICSLKYSLSTRAKRPVVSPPASRWINGEGQGKP